MQFETVFEECVKIIPWVHWGHPAPSSTKASQTFGLPPAQCITFFEEDIKNFHQSVDSIWCNKDKSVYYLSRKTIENYILSIVRTIKKQGEDAAKSDTKLRAQWQDLLNRKMESFTVCYPIYGVIVDSIVEIGPFFACNIKHHQQELQERLGIQNIQRWKMFSDNILEVYLFTSIQAKESERAQELARGKFELFENIAKFCLLGASQSDIGIFNYNGCRFEQGAVFSSGSNGFVVSSSLKGAYQPVPLINLATDFEKIWNIVKQYIDKTSTELESRLIHAMQWVGKANRTESNENKLVQYIFALEALLAFRPKGEMITPSIAYQLAEFGAFIVGENADLTITTKKDLRNKIFKDIKKIYSERSKIVHGHGDDCSTESIFLARDIMYALINSILANEEILRFTSMEQLSAWVTNKRFAS